MQTCTIRCGAMSLFALCFFITSLWADPCGMVPPIITGSNLAGAPAIKRIGAQMTYVFYKDDLETMVLRPGFSGNVDNFGMLIPFPTPPAIRKVPDNIFEQIAAAIDPPEVEIDLRPQAFGGFGGGFGGGMMGGMMGGFGGGGGLGFIPKDEVRVVREEAVGMYEVAVLAAGSAKALNRWMEDHGYRYPTGMDAVTEQYVEDRWCFVAVKTKVGQKKAADPKPGQREVKNDLPAGAKFDGHVQAMGFRFPSKELVVPMRLSAFNTGELRNVVYLLTDKPSKINKIPERFVKRQISGAKLYDQLTGPLPVRIIGGRARDISRSRRRSLKNERNPIPHNGVAARLFAADLLAAHTGELLSRHEELEKALLNISEQLDLRGKEIDATISATLKKQRLKLVRTALGGLDKLTMTVIDGDFPRELLADENLTFARYQMPLRLSTPQNYDAKELGPAPRKDGILLLGAIDQPATFKESTAVAEHSHDQRSATSAGGLWFSLSLFAVMFGLLVTRQLWRKTTRR